MSHRLSLLVSVSSLVLSWGARAEPVAAVTPDARLKAASCAIAKAAQDRTDAAKSEARAFASEKATELVDPENRADRAGNRLKEGKNVTEEGGMSHHRVSFDIADFTVRYETKSFDFVEAYTGELRTKVVKFEACWWKVGFVKTKGTCPRESWLVTNVPMVRKKHVEFSVPASLETKFRTVEGSYDLPTATWRDNRRDFDHAKADVERIQREIDAGQDAIAKKQTDLMVLDVSSTIDGIEKQWMAELDQSAAANAADFAKKKAELVEIERQARSMSGTDAETVEKTFASAFALLDRAESEAKDNFVRSKADAGAQIAQLREKYIQQGQLPSCTEQTESHS
ncbi:hypothetical protein ABIE89_002128 [Bradyrhizobium niftali]|uniref:hypothetical protein n=1 Tax=Bradyrhizobium niftali TaxID=2560055 RepID=UPI0038343108